MDAGFEFLVYLTLAIKYTTPSFNKSKKNSPVIPSAKVIRIPKNLQFELQSKQNYFLHWIHNKYFFTKE